MVNAVAISPGRRRSIFLTAAAVASSEGESGLGSDTGNSIRGPSAHNALVGIRSTMGLTSRAGVIPLSAAADVAGPMARTVADAVEVFSVVVGLAWPGLPRVWLTPDL